MASYLDKILSTKVQEVEQQKSVLNLDEIKLRIEDCPPRKEFIKAIKERNEKGLILSLIHI